MCLVIFWPNVDVLVSCVFYRWIILRIQLKKQRRVLTLEIRGYKLLSPLKVMPPPSQMKPRVLERLTTSKAPIDMVRRHEAKKFHGTNMEESNKAKFWLEKLQRILEEVRCPPDQRVSCAVSLLQSEAYDWWKLVLRSPRIPNPMHGNSLLKSSGLNMFMICTRKLSGNSS